MLLFTAVVPDVIQFLDNINIISGTLYKLLIWQLLVSLSISRTTRSSLFLPDRDNSIPFGVFFRVIATLLLCILI